MESSSNVIPGSVFFIVYWTLPDSLNADYRIDYRISREFSVLLEMKTFKNVT